MAASAQKCRISNIKEILEAINLAFVKSKKLELKKRDWHTALSSLTENKILPFWINEFFRGRFVSKMNAEKVKVAIEAQLKSLNIDLKVILECVSD